jgi:RNA polymerase sigma-70 factor (ECF subfamily)
MIDFSEHHRRAQMPLNLVFRLAEEVQQGRHMYQSSESPQRWATSFVGQWNGSPQQPSADVDACLIESVLKGKTDAFGDLVAPHLLSLTRFARMRLRSDVEAEDAVQQAVLQALHNLGQFRRQASFKTWISKITFNEILHVRRSKAIAPVTPLHQTGVDKLADPHSLPDIQLQKRQEAAILYRALARLPEKYRSIIELRDLHELSIAATAHSLSLTASAVKTRHHRARKLLLRAMVAGK